LVADFLPTVFFLVFFFLGAIVAVYHPAENGKAGPQCNQRNVGQRSTDGA
jgi:hypothetical protein